MRTDYSQIHFQQNGKLKLLIIAGTRPEIIRLSEVITKCRRHFDCILASIDEHSLLQTVEVAVDLNSLGYHGTPVPDYTEENVSTKVGKATHPLLIS